MARASHVFNAAQVDGFQLPQIAEGLGPVARLAGADRFVNATEARIEHGGDRAYFRVDPDHIQMPAGGSFTGAKTMTRDEAYCPTLVHELVQWT